MPPIQRERVHIPLKLRKDQINRLSLLRAALAEKMNKDMTISELLEKIVDDFLDSK